FVKVNDYFRICVSIELVSSRLQIMAQFGKIINFPVEHNPYVFIFIVYRLTAGRKVNNAQPAHTQSDAPLRVDPFIVRTTVDNGLTLGMHISGIDVFAAACYRAGYPTHCSTSSAPSSHCLSAEI